MKDMVTTWRVVCRKLLIIMLIYMLNYDKMEKDFSYITCNQFRCEKEGNTVL